MRRVSLLTSGILLAFGCSEIRTPTLEASADATTLSGGQTTQIHVLRHFEGGSFDDVTGQVTYGVDPKSIINLTVTGNNAQVTPASDNGVATVTITEADDTAFTTLRFTVVAAHIVSIHIDPSPAIILAPSQTQQFTALATMSDLTTQVVTNSVSWSSSNSGAASVGNSVSTFGLVTAIAEGDVTITATDTATNATGSALVLVRGGDAGAPAALAAINVTPNPASVGVGKTVALVAGAFYGDGTTGDLSKTATWTSSNPAVATVDANGVVTGVLAGDATITAAGPNGTVKGSTALTVQ